MIHTVIDVETIGSPFLCTSGHAYSEKNGCSCEMLISITSSAMSSLRSDGLIFSAGLNCLTAWSSQNSFNTFTNIHMQMYAT